MNITDYEGMKPIQTTGYWDVIFIFANPLLTLGVSDSLSMKVMETTLPSWSRDSMDQSLGIHDYSQPGRKVYNKSINLSLFETVDSGFMKRLEVASQMAQLIETGTTIHRLTDTGIIRIKMKDSEGNTTGSFNLTDAWLQAVDYGSLGSDPNGLFRPSLTFTYNQFIWLPI